MSIKTTARRIAASALVLGVGAVGYVIVDPADAGDVTILNGTFETLPAGTDLGLDIHGSAKLTIDGSGTVATVNVSGLDPNERYALHLHNAACSAANPGGGHYQDVAGTGSAYVNPVNELWLTTGTDEGSGNDPNPGGVVHGDGDAVWQARLSDAQLTNAKAIVMHGEKPEGFDPSGGPKLACADLG